jgi:hypothetical protein
MQGLEPTGITVDRRMLLIWRIPTVMPICNIFSICRRGKSYFHPCLYFRNFLSWRIAWKWNLVSRGNTSQRERTLNRFPAVPEGNSSSPLHSVLLSFILSPSPIYRFSSSLYLSQCCLFQISSATLIHIPGYIRRTIKLSILCNTV